MAAVLAASCGSANNANSNSVEAGGADDAAAVQAPADEIPDQRDGLVVDLRGIVDGSTICPGGTQPCVTLDRAPEQQGASGQEGMLVRVQFADGVATVLRSAPIESALANFTDRCDDTLPEEDFDRVAALSQEDQEAAEEDGTYAYDRVAQYESTIPDAYAIRWLSGSRRMHLGVVGEAEPHRAALAELGLAEVVCVVGGFAVPEAELLQVQNEVGDMLSDFVTTNESYGWSSDAFAGAVVVEMHRVDESMLNEANQRFGDLVQLNGAWTVLNGSLADLDRVLGQSETPSTQPGLQASCGSVVFSTVPPQLDEFPPLDGDIQAIFDEFMTGPLSVETDFLEGYKWTVATRTDERLVLFGQRELSPGDYVNVGFEKRGDVWQATGWGGCSIDVSAPGFGSATTILDPNHEPDPASTELHLLIMERECANGEAPIGRDVLPVITETDTTVEISTLVAPVAGGADCPGNPWHPIVATLSAPLGDRQVIDTQTSPGVERNWPPTNQELSG